ncbi:MAG TPA: L-rhamnose isomerase [Chloroflexota bacterium]|nr:L-rhamnose isomerase [Chloroflexota bacterium]
MPGSHGKRSNGRTNGTHTAEQYRVLSDTLGARGIDVTGVVQRLKAQVVETPSWGYGNSGTRFRVFGQPGVPRDPFEKFEDAAQVHKYTGICPSVAIHIPWDKVDDYGALQEHARSLGLRVGAINPNVFQDEEYKFGSMCHPDPHVRRKATDAMVECIEIGKKTNSGVLSLWFADGTNYPGQDDFRERKHRMEDVLTEVYRALPPNMRMMLEYKPFEPAFYATDLFDWGISLITCQKLGPQAQVLVDLGHHLQGTNVEQIVATLLDEGRLGGFHFNNRKYADDDLIVGSVNPFELFLIFCELVAAEQAERETTRVCAQAVAYMLDQSHNIERKIPAMIRSVLNVHTALAKALLVDRQALRERQQACDVIGANSVLMEAYETDVRPLLTQARAELNCPEPADPLGAFQDSGYLERIAEARKEGVAAGWS